MTWIQQHDSAVRLHFLGSLAGLSACTKIPKKSLLDLNSLDIFPKRESNMQQHCREAVSRASCPIRMLSDHCTAETPDACKTKPARDTGRLSGGTANCSWVSKQPRRTHPPASSSPPTLLAQEAKHGMSHTCRTFLLLTQCQIPAESKGLLTGNLAAPLAQR